MILLAHPELTELLTRIGWALLHSVWQITIVALLFSAMARHLRWSTPNLRYLLGCVAMFLMVAVPFGSFLLQPPIESAADNERLQPQANGGRPLPIAYERIASGQSAKSDQGSIHHPVKRPHPRTDSGVAPMPAADLFGGGRLVQYVAYAWLLGVVLLSTRPMLGLALARQITRQRTEVPIRIESMVSDIARRMGIRHLVRVAHSPLIDVPCVMGWLSPVILLPVSTVSGLTTGELRAILAHELAHVRRHDYILNLGQTLIETLLFYHPAVWWVSRCVRRERENCCDDLALTVCQDRQVLASALLAVGGVSTTPQVGLAADGGDLFRRVKRVLAPHDQRRGSSANSTIIVLFGVFLVGVSFTYWWFLPTSEPNGKDERVSDEMVNSEDNPSGEPEPGTLAYIEADRDEIFAAYHEGDAEAISEAHELLGWDSGKTAGVGAGESDAPRQFAIEHAELVVARSHGFESWKRLKQQVSGLTADAMCDAASSGDIEHVRQLAAARPELVTLERRGSFGEMTPLHFAVINGHVEVVRLLMELGADARATVYPHRRGTSSFDLARDRGANEMLDIIRRFEKKRRTDQGLPNDTVSDPLTRVIAAIREGRSKAAVQLLEVDDSLRNQVDETNSLPLHVAAGSHQIEPLQWLLAREPDLGARDNASRTPMDRAAASAHDEGQERYARFLDVVRLLREHGAPLTSRAAVVLGDQDAVRQMHGGGTLEEPRGLYGGGLLDLAVQSGDIEMLRLLLELGLEPDEPYFITEAHGDTCSSGAPLCRAIDSGRYDMTVLLLDHGARATTSVYASGTPIMSAIGQDDPRFVDLMLEHGAKLELYDISRRGRVDLATAVLADKDSMSDRIDLDGCETAADVADGMLCGAIDGGRVEVLRLCVPHLTEPPDSGLLPRTWWRVERTENLQMLLDAGADPNGVFRFGDTALHDLAKTRLDSEKQRLEFLEILLDAGAGFAKRDIFFESTPLGWACRFGRLDMVKRLVERGAPVNEPDAPSWATPLRWAETMGHTGITEFLRSRGATQ